MWQAKLEINLNNIMYNINQIKSYVGNDVDIMPIIKDDGYRTGLDKQIRILEKVNTNIVGISIPNEGIVLRNCDYDKDIFLLNQPYKEDLQTIMDYNIIVGVGSIDFLKQMGEYKGKFRIHIEIGTGMGRTGIHPNRIKEFIIETKKYQNIKIEGIYTHFSCSDCDIEYTKSQLKSFQKTLNIAKQEIKDLKYIHSCNSAAIVNFPEAHFNLVRPGIFLYGYYPSESLKEKIAFKPAIRLKSKVSFIKEVPKGTSISYGRKFITERTSKIATVQLGYADGLRRCMSNKGDVVINGELAPIVGAVCMDCFMVDVTDLDNINIGDEVFIWDNEHITVEDIASIYDTINYEVISTISNRVEREYLM